MKTKKCPVCDIEIVGRRDKKYCSAACKSMAQYEKRLQEETDFLEFERKIKTNRKVLKQYNKEGLTTIRRAVLYAEGFDPRFFTHLYKTKHGRVYYFTYEFGVNAFEHQHKGEKVEKFNIVTWQNYMKPIKPI